MTIQIRLEDILLALIFAILAAILVIVLGLLGLLGAVLIVLPVLAAVRLYRIRGVFKPLTVKDLAAILGDNIDKGKKHKKVDPGRCAECHGLLSVNQPVVAVYGLGNVEPLNFHADCLGKTEKGVYDLDPKKRELKRVSLSKLWKYKGKPNVLHTRSPIPQVLNIGHPDGSITRHITFPVNMREIKGPEKEQMRIQLVSEDKDQFLEGMKRDYDIMQDQNELQDICKRHLHHVVIWIKDGKQYFLKLKR